MSMICPGLFRENLKGKAYIELIKERDELIRSIRRFERAEASGDRTGAEWDIDPSPDVRYQVNLEYLSEICSFMYEKYNEDYVWGDCRFCDDL